MLSNPVHTELNVSIRGSFDLFRHLGIFVIEHGFDAQCLEGLMVMLGGGGVDFQSGNLFCKISIQFADP